MGRRVRIFVVAVVALGLLGGCGAVANQLSAGRDKQTTTTVEWTIPDRFRTPPTTRPVPSLPELYFSPLILEVISMCPMLEMGMATPQEMAHRLHRIAAVERRAGRTVEEIELRRIPQKIDESCEPEFAAAVKALIDFDANWPEVQPIEG